MKFPVKFFPIAIKFKSVTHDPPFNGACFFGMEFLLNCILVGERF